MPDFPTECVNYVHDYSNILRGKIGVEIGGPSEAFLNTGIYTSPAVLDNVVFSPNTIWGANTPNTPYAFNGKTNPGTTYIADVVDMHILQNESYDFVFASHVLEHLINPLKGLKEITRILKPGGLCTLILPWKEKTFDHNRPITPFAELLEHYEQNHDETHIGDHLEHIIQYHDIAMDPGVKTMEQFIARSQNNHLNRALHVHVFDFELMRQCFHFFNYGLVDVQLVYPYHQIMVGMKQPAVI